MQNRLPPGGLFSEIDVLSHAGGVRSNSASAHGWTLGIERFQNSIPLGIVDDLAQSLGRRME